MHRTAPYLDLAWCWFHASNSNLNAVGSEQKSDPRTERKSAMPNNSGQSEMDHIEAIRLAQYARADRIRDAFFARHAADIHHWHLERHDETFLRHLTLGDLSGAPLLCNSIVRKHFAYAWIDAMLAEYQQNPDRHRVWITIAWDTPLTWEREPIIDTVSLRNIGSQHLRRCDLEGTGVLEVDTWKEIAGEPGKRIVPHIHFLAWAKNGEKIDTKALAQSMRSRRAFPNSLGAPSVVVEPVGQSAEDLARLGYYLSKLPAYAKNPVPNRVRGGYELVQVEHAPGSVTRLIEVLSFMEVGDVVFSIGEGKTIARAVRERVREQLTLNRKGKPAPERDMIARHFRRIRLTNGNSKFRDCSVITRAHHRLVRE